MRSPGSTKPTAMLRLVAAYDRSLRRSFAALESFHTGLLLGLLRAGALDRMTQLSYRARALYLEPGYNGSGLFDWERDAIARHFRPGSRLLLAGCGGGRELLPLARDGFVVDAFDPNAEYVALARRTLEEQGLPGQVLQAEPSVVPAKFAGRYDGFVLGWVVYAHIVGRNQRLAFLRELRRRATAGAPLLLSFWVRRASSRRERMQHAVARLVARLSFNPRRPEAGDDLNQQAFVHWFDEAGIGSELREAGFEPVGFKATPFGHVVAIASDPIG